MIQPSHHCWNIGNCLAGGQVWARDHDYGQSQRTRSGQFCAGPLAARVFANDMGDPLLRHQRAITRHIKRAFGDNNRAVGQRRGHGPVDQTQQKVMLGLPCKSLQILFANRQKNPCGLGGQGGHSPRDIGHILPIIPLRRRPRRALHAQQGQSQRCAGGMGIVRHLGGKGVGCVNHMADALCTAIGRQSLCAAKAANARGQGLGGGGIGAPRIGKYRPYPRICQSARGKAGLRRAPQKQNMWREPAHV